MRTIVSPDGTPIACESGGHGPNLVLVHGTAASRTRWASVRPRLEESFTVTAIDRRGSGDSGDNPDYAFGREVEDIIAVLATLDPPTVLFGHSFGAICSLEAALRSDRLTGLVLYEPPIFEGNDATSAQIAQLDALLAVGDREGAVTIFMQKVVGLTPQAFGALRSSAAWAGRVAAAHTLPREMREAGSYRLVSSRIGTLAIPVLLLLGGASPPPFGAVIARIAAALPNARTIVMPGQHHNAMDTAPDLVIGALQDFWRVIA